METVLLILLAIVLIIFTLVSILRTITAVKEMICMLRKKGYKSLDIKSVPSVIKEDHPDLVVFKEYLEAKLDEARSSLAMIDEMQPQFIYSSDDDKEISGIPLTMTEEKWESERMQMREICNSPKVKYAALLFDSFIFTGDAEKAAEIQRRGTDLQDVGGTIDVIMLFLYTRNNTLNRRIEYEKRDVEDYWFADRGYQDVNDPGDYVSPFPAK